MCTMEKDDCETLMAVIGTRKQNDECYEVELET